MVRSCCAINCTNRDTKVSRGNGITFHTHVFYLFLPGLSLAHTRYRVSLSRPLALGLPLLTRTVLAKPKAPVSMSFLQIIANNLTNNNIIR